MKEFINVLEDSYTLWEYCVANDFTEMEYEEWSERGGDLSFFDGDPDMVKVDGWTGYFCECGDKVFYYFDDCFDHTAEVMLRAFFEAFRTGITLGGESWVSGENPEGVSDVDGDYIWDEWDSLETGIAFRGGAGYWYRITDWTEWLEAHKGQKAA